MSNLFSRLSLRANIVTAAMAAFFLAACGGDGNKANEPDPSAEADFVVDSFGDLSVCTGNREGATAYVKDEDHDYICTDGDWAIDTNADTRKKSSNSKDKAKSGSRSGNQKAAWDYLNREIDYGEMVDGRDGQTYKTVKIGDQVWMAENLNYKVDSSWCGGGKDSTEGDCSKYGRLYLWLTAIDSAKLYKDESIDCGYGKTCSLPDTVYGICPSGWHLPDTTDWKTLFDAVGGKDIAGKMLKSQSGWNDYNGTSGNGTDAYGFSAFPAGGRDSGGDFSLEGDVAQFWSATEYNSISAYSIILFSYHGEYALLDDIYKGGALSVRCLKDDP